MSRSTILQASCLVLVLGTAAGSTAAATPDVKVYIAHTGVHAVTFAELVDPDFWHAVAGTPPGDALP